MLSLLVFLFILGVLIVAHEFGHFIAARRTGVRVEKFSFGFGPCLFKRKSGGTEYCLSALPLGGYVKLAGDTRQEYKGQKDEYLSQPVSRRFAIIFSGPLVNYLLGFLFFWVILFAGYPSFTTKVGSLLDGYGAKDAGVSVGDKIVSVDGVGVDSWDQMQKLIRKKEPSQKVRLSILRQDKQFELEVILKPSQAPDAAADKKYNPGLIGITPADEMIKVRYGLVRAFVLAAEKTTELTAITCRGLWWLATGKLSVRDSMTGPLGIFYIASRAASLGIVAVLHLMAVLSISLAIFNLLPLPVLDGGHILFLFLEKIRGKALTARTEEMVTRAGLTLIVALALFVTYNDILRLFGDKIAGIFK